MKPLLDDSPEPPLRLTIVRETGPSREAHAPTAWFLRLQACEKGTWK